VSAEAAYDFRKSDAYARFSARDREKLEQVKRDQVLLWGALDMYADEHEGNPPRNLDELTPRYLKDLPSDPFATEASAAERDLHGYTQSKKGWGYRYMRGAPGNRAWVGVGTLAPIAQARHRHDPQRRAGNRPDCVRPVGRAIGGITQVQRSGRASGGVSPGRVLAPGRLVLVEGLRRASPRA
jgi:hypothetical protein